MAPQPPADDLTRRATGRVWGQVSTAPDEGPPLDAPPVDADVVVVGGGITGLTTALMLRRGGVDVTLVEARTPGAGTTGGTTGKVSLLQGRHVQEIRSRHGDDATAEYLAQSLAAQQWVADEAGSDGTLLERRAAVTYTTSTLGRRRLEREAEAMGCGGLTPEWLDGLPGLPYPVEAAIRLEGQLQLHPVRWLEHLLAELRRPPAAGEGRCHVSTGWRVVDLSDGRPVTLTAVRDGQEQQVRAGRVVVATLLPFLDRGLLFARSEPTRSWCLAAELDETPPQDMYLGIDTPSRSLRTVTGGGGLLVGGNSHTTGRGGPTSERLADLDRWTRRHFPVRRVTAAWAAQDYTSADRLPWVGPLLPTNDRVLVASGFAKWGMTGGTAAAMQCTEALLGSGSRWPWSPWRTTPVPQLVGAGAINAGVAWRAHSGWARGLARGSAETAAPAEGEGVVRRSGRRLCGISTVDGVTRARSAVCTHLGGVVSWNDAERSWDCPLHGSRFGADGEVLDAPAVDPLT